MLKGKGEIRNWNAHRLSWNDTLVDTQQLFVRNYSFPVRMSSFQGRGGRGRHSYL